MILIRADANEIIGTGHVMRCLSIARAFAKRGEKVTFVTADHRGDGLIQQNGFSCVCLDGKWTDLDGELDALKKQIKEEAPSILLVDSYYVTEKYFSSLSENVKTVYMDDLNTTKWNVDVLINYNIFSSVFDYAAYEDSRTTLFLGPDYAPLRDEFKNCPKHKMNDITDILVSAGGADPERITEKMITGVCPVHPDVSFHFIVGTLNSRLDDIKKKAAEKKNAILHINEQHMSDLMKTCDIAISAAGSTLYELCACGTPTITYTLADNQLMAAEQFDKQGIMLSAGDCREDEGFIRRAECLLQRLCDEIELRSSFSTRMQELVDGNGADRIADTLL